MANIQTEKQPAKWFGMLALIAGVLLVILNVLRIFKIPMTFDECAPHAEAVRPYLEIIQFKAVSSNNHILNSLLRKFFVQAFSDTPFWRRFDSLLAQVVYLVYSYRTCCRLFKKLNWQLCAFLLLNLYPFLFEFWGLSRGYGMAISLTLVSAYYLINYIDERKILSLNLGLYAAILAVYANFTLLDYFFGILGCVVFQQIVTADISRQQKIREWISLSLASAILYALVGGPIHKLVQAHELYYGGTKNIVTDTIISVIKENLFISGVPGKKLYLLASVVVLSVLVTGSWWLWRLFRKKADHEVIRGSVLWLLLAVPGVAVTAQHVLLNTLYPIDRTALFFIPLFILSLTYWLYYIQGSYSFFSKASLYVLTIAITTNFLVHMNMSTTRVWWFGDNDLVVFKRIISETKNKPSKNRLYVYWLFEPSFSYYIESQYSSRFEPVKVFHECPADQDSTFDYYYTSAECMHSIPSCYAVDTSFCGGSFYLMRRK
jgi:hypothetical protein